MFTDRRARFERRVHRGLKQHENLLPALFPNEVFCVRLHKSFLAAGRDRSFRERFSLFRARLPNSPPWSRPASRVTSTSPARTTGATTTTSWTYVPDRPVSRVPSLAARASEPTRPERAVDREKKPLGSRVESRTLKCADPPGRRCLTRRSTCARTTPRTSSSVRSPRRPACLSSVCACASGRSTKCTCSTKTGRSRLARAGSRWRCETRGCRTRAKSPTSARRTTSCRRRRS